MHEVLFLKLLISPDIREEFFFRWIFVWHDTAKIPNSVNRSSHKQRNLLRAREQHAHVFAMHKRIFFFNGNNNLFSVKSLGGQLNTLGSIIIIAVMNKKEHYSLHNAVPPQVNDSVLVCFQLTFCVSSYQILQITLSRIKISPNIPGNVIHLASLNYAYTQPTEGIMH